VRPLDLRWLGQSGFLVRHPAGDVLVDPWFSAHELREWPAPRIEDLPGRVAWLLATHEHGDHLDLPALPALMEHQPDARIVLPGPLVARTSAVVPGSQVIGVQPGTTVEGPGVRVTAVRAWHGVTVDDGYTDGRGVRGESPTPFCGFVVEIDGAVLYHAGDTILGEGMIDELRPLGIDVALLPVNGRDAAREEAGILGNLWPDEAIELATAIGARWLVPMHFDMVRGNTIAPETVLGSSRLVGGAPRVVIPTRHGSLTLP
jgi:L-ascorbate metabolism protein UlaG (beta-lactamase superfamily)